MVQSILIESGAHQAQFLLENNSSESIPIVISAHRRIQDKYGQEELPQAPELEIFPPQIILPAGEKRSVRVRWSGERPSQELAYRVIAEQVPVDIQRDQERQGIQMLLRYEAALYVRPQGTQAKVDIKKYDVDENFINIIIENQGGRHKLLNNPRLEIESGGKKYQLTSSDLEVIDGQNVLAGSQRKFQIKNAKNLTSISRIRLRVD